MTMMGNGYNKGAAILFGILLFFDGAVAKLGGMKQNGAAKTRTREIRRLLPLNAVGSTGDAPESALPLPRCWGDCDTDDDCQEGLICFQRTAYEAVPGCEGGEDDWSESDFCVPDPSLPTPEPTMKPTRAPNTFPSVAPSAAPTAGPTDAPSGAPSATPTIAPSDAPTGTPTGEPTFAPSAAPTIPLTDAPTMAKTMIQTEAESALDMQAQTMSPTSSPAPSPQPTDPEPFGKIEYIGNEGTFYAAYPLGPCLGDCDTDDDCAEGLICYQRVANEAVPFCLGGVTESSTADFCTWDGISPVPSVVGPPPPGMFHLKLYWEEGYRWQNETFERDWCMTYNFDGYPGTGLCWYGDNNQDCSQDHVYVGKCIDDPRQWFTFVELGDERGEEEVLIQTGDGLRCFERDERRLFLAECDEDNRRQRWFALNGALDGDKFELSQIGYTSQCITNDHHPKSGEVVELHSCEDSRSEESQTSYWRKGYDRNNQVAVSKTP